MSYVDKLENFRKIFEEHHNNWKSRLFPNLDPDKVEIEQGYKFDKVYLVTPDGKKIGRFMVETRTEEIFGIKSWTQINKRRRWGTLDQVDQWDWSHNDPIPLPGTDAERELLEREESIRASYKKRGRKPKSEKIK